MKKLIITGIRGVPATHGGFETFAENLTLFLVNKGWSVDVYCQESKTEYPSIFESEWCGVRRIHIPVHGKGAKATVLFDYLSIKHASGMNGLVLTLGYNTAIFNALLRVKGIKNVINMDGIEWKRAKWSWYEKAWLYMNERAACLIGHHLIADHPAIAQHLGSRTRDDKITMIPYGARSVASADASLITTFGIHPKSYAVLIARPEPENSIYEIVKAFSSKTRGMSLVVLGRYDEDNTYHQKVIQAASHEVRFVGAVYEHAILDALRFHAALYIHGHTVGGTNPSLIEALGAGQAILAHDNPFNRWVVGEGAAFFRDETTCSELLDKLLKDTTLLDMMAVASRRRYAEEFTWDNILLQYEKLLSRWCRV
ncbi:MAG: DUF1972 domain-containing protein [Halothiobacillaceae bacterium]|nr:DUF1972 domain-containing protein [Halothiobacillaceae bacterium]